MMYPNEILGVEPDADLETIKRAYLDLAKTAHPDAGGSKEEFVRLHTAFETLVNHRGAETSCQTEDQAKEYTEQRAGTTSFEDIKKEVEERLAREFADRSRRSHHQSPSSMSFWLTVALTPLCAGAVGTCLCHDGQPLDRTLWSFSFAVAMGILVYLGTLVAILGASHRTSGLKLYRRVIAFTSIMAVLMYLPQQSRRKSVSRPRPVISRDFVPSWWPGQSR